MSSKSPRARVCIVGGGIAGTALALLLHRCGFDISVYEGHEGPSGVGGALTIAPNGMGVLATLGLAEATIARGTIIETFNFNSIGGRHLGSMPYGPTGLYNQPAVSLNRATIHQMLVQAIADANIEMRYAKRLERVEQDLKSVRLLFEDGSDTQCDLLVGADGIWSAVRRSILPAGPIPAFTGLIGGGGFVPRSRMLRLAGREGEMSFYFGRGLFFGCACGDRTEENGAYWWYALAEDAPLSPARRVSLAGPNAAQILLEAGLDANPKIAGIIGETSEIIPPLDLFDVARLPRWHVGRVVLAGDAAHAVSPHSGQGASMALEDALVLARALRTGGGAFGGALLAYENERRPRAERVVAMGRKSGDQKRRGRIATALQLMLMPIFLKLTKPPVWLFEGGPRWDDTRESSPPTHAAFR